MTQIPLLDVTVLHEMDSTLSFDGADLKRIARGDDGHDYACKRMQDGPAIPLCEWVGHHLWRACGLLTPECAVLHYPDDAPPAFGSRLELLASQVVPDAVSYTIVQFFREHLPALSRCYPLDAFFANPDRHGRNFLARPSLTGHDDLLAIDWSRAWIANGQPFGSEDVMHTGHSRQWWNFFRDSMRAPVNCSALDTLLALDGDWLAAILHAAPAAWRSPFDTDSIIEFWHDKRHARADFARQWTTQP